jgi:FdhE protein
MPLFDPGAEVQSEAWRKVLRELIGTLGADSAFPAGVAAVCQRIATSSRDWLESQADALLAQRGADIDAATAPFLMAALQVVHTARACALSEAEVPTLATQGVCPVCGSLPVASIVHVAQPYQGYRFLHCSLCATEWHRVRVQCTTCDATKDIGYHSIADAPDAVRAESCESCKTYRKILYPEKDPEVEPVADDLASMALDLLLGEAGYARASGNPLLWQHADA